MSSLFAWPSIAGALSWANQLPSDICTSEEPRALGLTLTRMRVATRDICDLAAAGAGNGLLMRRRQGSEELYGRGVRRRGALRPAPRSLPVVTSPGVQGRPVRSSM